MIKQSELNDFQDLSAKLKALEAMHTKAKKSIVERLRKLEHVQVGDWQASLIPLTRRVPAWKEAFIRACGVEAAESVTEATEPSTTESLKVTLRPGVLA